MDYLVKNEIEKQALISIISKFRVYPIPLYQVANNPFQLLYIVSGETW